MRKHHKRTRLCFTAHHCIYSGSIAGGAYTLHDSASQAGLVCCICARYKQELSYSSHCDLDIKYHTQQYRKIVWELLGKEIFLSAAE